MPLHRGLSWALESTLGSVPADLCARQVHIETSDGTSMTLPRDGALAAVLHADLNRACDVPEP